MIKKLAFSTLPFACVALFVPPAAAQPDPPPATPAPSDADVCAESYEHSQEQMRPNQAESTLLKARESLRTCLRSSCKSWMVSDCSKWLSEVETRIPTVVFAAKDAAGQDLNGVRVTTKAGAVLVEQLDGRAIELEPGQHDFVFLASDGTRVERHSLIREGEKAQAVIAMFGPRPADKVGPARPVGSTATETPTLRYVGYGAAGLGVVGLGVGAVAGLFTISRKGSDCDAKGECNPGTRDSLSSTAAISTVAFIAGAALVAGGVAIVLLSPTKTHSPRVDARLTLGGAAIGGQW